ncbi:MAG: hypothetical protein NC342_02050 [Pseudoflavonifractor sp.]|nr:hypothetical protein [Alloprevotella sp.]MCM1116307.1 hypothetical protein [Pseudoflavonifractor sp.]
MKTFLLLSALAAPLLMVANDDATAGDNTGNQDPAPATPKEVTLPVNPLAYKMPAGTFFPVIEATGNGIEYDGNNPALIPPTTPLTWINNSQTSDGATGVVIPWAEGVYTWYNGPLYNAPGTFAAAAIGRNQYDLTTAATASICKPGLFTSASLAPVLTEETSFYPGADGKTTYYEGEAKGVKYVTPDCDYVGNSKYFPFNAAALEEAAEGSNFKSVFTYDALNGGFNEGWSNIGEGETNYAGFAQRVDYPGCNYILSTVKFQGITEQGGENSGSYTLAIYEAPAEGSATLGKKIASVSSTSKSCNNGVFTVGKIIDCDIVIVAENITVDEFAPTIFTGSYVVDKQLPVENQGLYIVGVDNEGTANLIEWNLEEQQEVIVKMEGEDEALSGSYYQATLPVAMGVELGVSYPLLQPYQEIGGSGTLDASQPVTVNLSTFTSTISYRVISSEKAEYGVNQYGEKVPFITTTGAPSWLAVTINDPQATNPDEEGHIPFPDNGYGTLETTAKKNLEKIGITKENPTCQYVVVTFTLLSEVKNQTGNVKLSIPGAECDFIVNANKTDGISDAIASEAQVTGRQYFDLSGRQLKGAPESGFYIEKVTRADGTTTATRMMR